MPVYVYETIQTDGSAGERFEFVQSMHDSHLTNHPETGLPVKRILMPPNISSKHTEGQASKRLDNKNLEKTGFTKYEKDKLTGQYHRVAGKAGPEVINRPTD